MTPFALETSLAQIHLAGLAVVAREISMAAVDSLAGVTAPLSVCVGVDHGRVGSLQPVEVEGVRAALEADGADVKIAELAVVEVSGVRFVSGEKLGPAPTVEDTTTDVALPFGLVGRVDLLSVHLSQHVRMTRVVPFFPNLCHSMAIRIFFSAFKYAYLS